jgi:hypothetical protein
MPQNCRHDSRSTTLTKEAHRHAFRRHSTANNPLDRDERLVAEPVSTIPSEFAWNAGRERAAELVATDDLTDFQIAAEVGVTKRTLEAVMRSIRTSARPKRLTAAVAKGVGEPGASIVLHRRPH